MGKKNRRMAVAAGEAKAAEVIPLPTSRPVEEPSPEPTRPVEEPSPEPTRPVEEPSRSDDVNDVVDGMRASEPLPDRAVGWTPEITARLGWFMKKGQGFHDLCLEVDQDQAHFIVGLVALAAGNFDLAALNLHKAGMLEAPPSVVEEEEV